MRKVIPILLVAVLWFEVVVAPAVAHADGMILPEALSPGYLTVRSHEVTVRIEGNHAVTRVEQEFVNPHSVPVTGLYLFPVPPDAILSRFEATLDGQVQPVISQDPAATNDALYEALVRRRDPSLLQYFDWRAMAFDIYLPAGGSRQMSLEYEEVLTPTGGLYRYRYVLSTERYSAQPLEQVSVSVELDLPGGLSSLYSPSHPVATERLGAGRARVNWEAQDVRPGEDFELFYAPAAGGFGGGLLTGRRAERDHFLFLFAPEAEPAGEGTLPKDIVFVVDHSGSMAGEKMEQARNALHYMLGRLNQGDRFSIVAFDDRLSVLAQSPQRVQSQALAEARWFVDALAAEGSTDLESALQAGLAILAHSPRERRQEATQIVLFLTDGLPTEGATDAALIADLVAQSNAELEARLHVFGVGYDVNTHLLDRLAAENGGTVTYVQPGENLEAVLSGFYERIASPVLTDVEISFQGMKASDLHPATIPDLFRGSSLLLTGRYEAMADRVTVRVRGVAAGVEQRYTYQFVPGEGHDFVPRLWATRRVGELLDRVRVEGESEQLVSELRELGLAYGLVTPYTTAIIEAQSGGPASTVNMNLYLDQASLNEAWGQTTVQARVHNQAYQQAAQANLAAGANVVNYGQYSLAQIADQNVDLRLLQRAGAETPVTAEWIERHLQVQRTVEFASKDYLDLVQDPEARPLLQGGPNVVFEYQGEVIAVRDAGAPDWQDEDQDVLAGAQGPELETAPQKDTIAARSVFPAVQSQADEREEALQALRDWAMMLAQFVLSAVRTLVW